MGFITDWFSQTIQRHPVPLRTALRLLDSFGPPVVARKLAIKSSSVREVFERPNDFLMGYLNAPKLKLGDFLLGMDPGPKHSQEKTALEQALNASLAEFPAFVAYESDKAARRLAEISRARGRFDLVTDYAEPVFVRSLAHYFGLPVDGIRSDYLDTEPGVQTLGMIIRKLGSTIASAHPAPFGLESLATRVASQFKVQLSRAIAQHRDGSINTQVEPAPDGVHPLIPDRTVIGRLIAQGDFQDGDEGIARSVGGMLSASAGFPKAFTHALHELLLRPNDMRACASAALASDEPTLRAYVREALRFRPVFPLLIRYCPHAAALRGGAQFPAGSTLPFFPLTAMFDPASVPAPEEFNPRRPADVYAIFGGAPRACIGEELIMSLFLPMFRALFTYLPDVRKAKLGQLRYDGAGIASYEMRAG